MATKKKAPQMERRLNLRIDGKAYKKITRAARKAKQPLSVWIRDVLEAAA